MEKWEGVFKHLVNAEFHRIWRGKDLDAFYDFLREQAVPAGGFLISVPLDIGFGWFFFPVAKVERVKEGLQITYTNLEAQIPTPETDEETRRTPPEEWRGYPVWRISPQDL